MYSEGRGAAAEVDAWLSHGSTRLPTTGGIKTRVSICFNRLKLRTLTSCLAALCGPSKLPNEQYTDDFSGGVGSSASVIERCDLCKNLTASELHVARC